MDALFNIVDSRRGIMSKLNIEQGEELYTDTKTRKRVIAGYIATEPKLPVVIKEYTFTDYLAANLVLREALATSALSHPHIVKVYDFYLDRSLSGGLTINLVMERMERDAQQCIAERSQRQSYWTEEELWGFLKTLVNALSYAQRQGISHRDIKPQNVLMSANTVKICDFGVSARNLDISNTAQTITGTPLYLSPELKSAYIQYLSTSQKNASYDPVKSDVYSLGVTILAMAILRLPEELARLKGLEEATAQVIGGLHRYPLLQPWLETMLQVAPENRCTFCELEEHIRTAEQQTALTSPQVALPQPRPEYCPCGQAIPSTPWYSSAPEFLRNYTEYFPYYCSEACLSTVLNLFPKHVCVRCHQSTNVQELACGHRAHVQCWDGGQCDTQWAQCPHGSVASHPGLAMPVPPISSLRFASIRSVSKELDFARKG